MSIIRRSLSDLLDYLLDVSFVVISCLHLLLNPAEFIHHRRLCRRVKHLRLSLAARRRPQNHRELLAWCAVHLELYVVNQITAVLLWQLFPYRLVGRVNWVGLVYNHLSIVLRHTQEQSCVLFLDFQHFILLED